MKFTKPGVFFLSLNALRCLSVVAICLVFAGEIYTNNAYVKDLSSGSMQTLMRQGGLQRHQGHARRPGRRSDAYDDSHDAHRPPRRRLLPSVHHQFYVQPRCAASDVPSP